MTTTSATQITDRIARLDAEIARLKTAITDHEDAEGLVTPTAWERRMGELQLAVDAAEARREAITALAETD